MGGMGGFLGFVGEAEQSRAAKRQQREDQTITVENLAGGALKKARKGTSLDPTKVVAPPTLPLTSLTSVIQARIKVLQDTIAARAKRAGTR